MINSSIVRSGSGWKSGYRMAILLLAVLAVELGCNRPRSISQRERDVSLDFLGKFETVAFVRGPVLAKWMSHSERTPESDLVAPYGPFLLALDRLGLDLARQVVGASTAVFLGAYDFQGPKGPPPSLGPVESKACALFLMSGDAPTDLLKSLDDKAGPRINGEWSWEVKEERFRRMRVWASIKAPDGLVLCNFMNGTGKALADSARPEMQVAAWSNEYLRSKIAQSEYWMVRQVRHSNVDRMAAALDYLGTEVETIALVPGSRSGECELVTLRKSKGDSPLHSLEVKEVLPEATQNSSGAWITRLRLSLDQKDSDAMFGAIYLLGFGMYL